MDSLASIEKSLDNLEEVLAPLLETDLPKTLSQLDLLQKAKLQVLLPYVINDLVFIYLKTRGINPKTHPVVGELDRIKQYFEKIKNAEDPEKRKFAVDQGAATRFIKHAIKESQAAQEQANKGAKKGPHTRPVEATVTGTDASAAAIAKIQARAAMNASDDSSSENEELEVFAGDPSPPKEVDVNARDKGKGKEKEDEDAMVGTSTRKKRRRGMDPWTGYDETAAVAAGANMPEDRRRKKSKGNRSPPQTASTFTGVDIEAQQGLENDKSVASGSNKRSAIEVIDIDALPDTSGSHTKPMAGRTFQLIDVDAIDSSRSSTPSQTKKKKKKGKKQKS